ncbi:unnamed protein product, partial [Nesidiocoris tenuis]
QIYAGSILANASRAEYPDEWRVLSELAHDINEDLVHLPILGKRNNGQPGWFGTYSTYEVHLLGVERKGNETMDEESLLAIGPDETHSGRSSPDLNSLRRTVLETLPNQLPPENHVVNATDTVKSYPDWAEQLMAMQKSMVEEIKRLKRHIESEIPIVPKLPMSMEVDGDGMVACQEHLGNDRVPKAAKMGSTPAQDRLERQISERGGASGSSKTIQWGAKHVHSIKFPKLDIKLEQNGEVAFNLWYRTIIDAIESQDCAFLLTGEDMPESYNDNERDKRLAAKKLKLFLMSHLDLHYQGMHKTLIRSCDVKCLENVVYGDKIKDFPKPLAEMLEICTEEDSSESGFPDEKSKDASTDRLLYIEPNSFKEAMNCPERDLWEDSIRDELSSLESNGTWEFLPKSELPSGTKVIKARWVYKRKLEANGTHRYKNTMTSIY